MILEMKRLTKNLDKFNIQIIYSFPSFVLALMAISYYVYIPKLYSKTISLGSIGFAILITRLFDALIDPLIGHLSDKHKIPRKLWMCVSVIPLCLSYYFLFTSSGSLFWFYIHSICFFFFWTTYSIPYEAAGQNLYSEYNKRTILFSFRDGFLLLGTLFAAAIPVFLKNWTVISIVYSLLLVAFTITYYLRIKELELPSKLAKKLSFKPFSILKSNRHFRKLLISYILSAFGSALPATLFLFYVEYVLGSNNGEFFLLLYFLVGILFLPFWTKFSFKFEKKTTWLLAMAINTLGFFGVFFIESELAYSIFIVISAIGYGAVLVMPSSIQADVIDYEEHISGQRKEGQFIGLWSLAKKTVAALSAGIALWILGSSGFDANLASQTKASIYTMKVLYCLVPCVCNVLAILNMLNFSLNRKEQQSVKVSNIAKNREGGHAK